MSCSYINELYMVVLSRGDMDVAVGRGYRTYPSPNGRFLSPFHLWKV